MVSFPVNVEMVDAMGKGSEIYAGLNPMPHFFHIHGHVMHPH